MKTRSIEYQTHLQSERWQRLRRQAIRLAGCRCQICGAGGRLDLHHRSYVNLGREGMGDVAVLCRRCHDMVHELGKVLGTDLVNGQNVMRLDKESLTAK